MGVGKTDSELGRVGDGNARKTVTGTPSPFTQIRYILRYYGGDNSPQSGGIPWGKDHAPVSGWAKVCLRGKPKENNPLGSKSNFFADKMYNF